MSNVQQGKEMDLKILGYDDWLASHASVMLKPGQSLARVMTVDRGAFLIRNEHGETRAELSGKYRFETESASEIPCVGDWVCVEQASSLAIIHAVLPRKTFLRRKSPGKTVDFQMIATNVDIAFIVQSCHYDFNVRRLDRYLVSANDGNVEPVIILSKTDLVTPEDLTSLINKIKENGISARILPLSNLTGSGLTDLQSTLQPGKTFCLLGSSGVGKTTIINHMLGKDVLITKAVSETGEGVHTTARRQLIMLDNGAMLIDTPGMRELGLLDASGGIEESFPDIQDLSVNCRFSNCTHTREPGCAVLAAIAAGELSEEHHQSYTKLRKEADYHDLSYAGKRKKDRDFGKFLKTAKKSMKH